MLLVYVKGYNRVHIKHGVFFEAAHFKKKIQKSMYIKQLPVVLHQSSESEKVFKDLESLAEKSMFFFFFFLFFKVALRPNAMLPKTVN